MYWKHFGYYTRHYDYNEPQFFLIFMYNKENNDKITEVIH